MVAKRRIAWALVALALGLVVMPIGAQANNPTVCQLAGQVSLTSETQVSNATNGSGSFGTGFVFRCAGTTAASGAATLSGVFNFCRHNMPSPSSNPACHGSGYNGPANNVNNTYVTNVDAVYDPIGHPTAGLSAHVKSGTSTNPNVSVLFANGALCSLQFEGHAAVAQAELYVQLTCGSTTLQGTAIADAIPELKVCQSGNGLCFEDLQFVGEMVMR